MDLKVLHRLAQLMERDGLTEVEIAEQDSRIRVVRAAGSAPSVPVQDAVAPSTNDLDPEPEVESHYVTSPMPGTFYTAQSPEAAPFVSVGEVVKPGKIVGIVEAMKVMNEIKCEFSGTVTKVLVPNGSPVEYGQKLFEIQ